MGEKYFIPHWVIVLVVFTLYTNVAYYIFNIIYDVQKSPYIDEIFHIAQAKKYCNGTFDEWDPKITTLPGVYLLSVGVIKPISYVLQANLCTTYVLRTTNLIANSLNFIILYLILKKIYIFWENDKQKILFSALNIAIFPPLYFFTFLYYTEPVAIMLVLLTILIHLHDNFSIAAFISFVSVLARQTNIVWVVLLVVDGAIYVLNFHAKARGNKLIIRIQSSPKYVKVMYQMLLAAKDKFRILVDCVISVAGYILVIVIFVLFVIINGSIVVGDKQSHVAVIHLPQIFYLALFYLIFTVPFSVMQVYPFGIFVAKKWKFTTFVFLSFCVIVYFNTLIHPYLLADNRHYTFYIWYRVYQRHFIVPYILISVYMFGLFCIYNNINHLNFINQLGFIGTIALCLIPQQLLEVRYFIIPFLLLRLQIKTFHWWQLLLEFVINSAFNIVTIYLFINKTFYWTDINEPQRIMW